MRFDLFLSLLALMLFSSCGKNDNGSEPVVGKLNITYINIGGEDLNSTGTTGNISLEDPIEIGFDKVLNTISAQENITLLDESNNAVELTFSFFGQNQLVKIAHPAFSEGAPYTLKISDNLEGENGETFSGQTYSFVTIIPPLVIEQIVIDGTVVNPLTRIKEIGRTPQIDLHFNSPVNKNDLMAYSFYKTGSSAIGFAVNQIDEKTISIVPNHALNGFTKYQLTISSGIENQIGKPFEGLDLNFYTGVDPTPKFPVITDEELLTEIQQQTFKYFWDFGHPVSGLARERNTSGEIVTSGGSGFGIMAILVGIERGFISRSEGVARLQTVVDFLTNADRFHGAWSHWLNGTTGKALPFSTKDNGGDLVETSYMAAGLLAARQYLDSGNSTESQLIGKINELWKAIEWNWYTQGGQNVLYWHWSPDYAWEMNMKIQGYNEALITYIMAASSETHPISAEVYHQGWERNGTIVNGKEFYGFALPVGQDYGGPLFFAHYSFLGIDPRQLTDHYANYWEQNRNHTLINREYCVRNPKDFVGYSDVCWGLTASDNHDGYSAHSPTNDLGVIAPTAVISSIPYTPEESLDAIRFFYYQLGDRLWGDYGFYDAFNVTESWTASSYLAIDQGPMIVMIENYRTGLIWDLLMSCPEVQAGLTKLGFTY